MAGVALLERVERNAPSWRTWLPGLVLAEFTVALVLFTTPNGPGISPDSEHYLLTGRLIAAGHGLPEGWASTAWPPGFPMLLALGELVGVSGETVSRLICAASAGLVVWLVWRSLERTCTPAVAFVATAFVAVSPSLLDVSTMVWSEAPFIAVTLGFLTLLDGPYTERRIAAMAGLVWAAFLLRYAGLTLIPTGFAVIALRREWRQAGRFAALAPLVPVFWMWGNYRLDGTLMGFRYSSRLGIGSVLRTMTDTVGRWVLPIGTPPTWLAVALGVAALAVVAVAVVRQGWSAHAVFVAVYVPYSIASQLRYTLDPLTNRLMSPIFPSLVILAAGVVSGSDPDRVHQRRLDERPIRVRQGRVVDQHDCDLTVEGQTGSSITSTNVEGRGHGAGADVAVQAGARRS